MQRVDSGLRGFTLIELSIVLVVIGLVVGGVLVGQDLIRAAYIRAQISQIEKYNTATNTFYGKYRALPGDMNASTATTFGFAARGAAPGEGDGNGIIESNDGGGNQTSGAQPEAGENGMFWVDLSSGVAGGLIDGGFNTASATLTGTTAPQLSGTLVGQYFPTAKMGNGNYIYVSSGGYGDPYGTGDGKNYFNISLVPATMNGTIFSFSASVSALTVSQAYNIDKKTDDGLPQNGRVMAYTAYEGAGGGWASGASSPNSGAYDPTTNGPVVGGDGVPTPSSSTTCYDNGGVAGATETYSTEISNGAFMNCALSFMMQAGD